MEIRADQGVEVDIEKDIEEVEKMGMRELMCVTNAKSHI